MSTCKQKTVLELKDMCKDRGVKGFSKMGKDDLVQQCCEKFSSEFGAPVSAVQDAAEKERVEKISTINEMRDVVFKKISIANSWLQTHEKTTGKPFAYGPHDNRSSEIKMDPKYYKSRWGEGYSNDVRAHDTIIKFSPFEVIVFNDEAYEIKFTPLPDGKILTCQKAVLNDYYCTDGKNNTLEHKGDSSPIMAGTYEETAFNQSSFTCIRHPAKCTMTDLGTALNALDNANKILDKARVVIMDERARSERESKEMEKKRANVKASLKDWS